MTEEDKLQDHDSSSGQSRRWLVKAAASAGATAAAIFNPVNQADAAPTACRPHLCGPGACRPLSCPPLIRKRQVPGS